MESSTKDHETRKLCHLLTAAQLAIELGPVNPRVIASEIRSGKLRSVRIGGRAYVPRSELQRLSGVLE